MVYMGDDGDISYVFLIVVLAIHIN
jgi:hypothetical protein